MQDHGIRLAVKKDLAALVDVDPMARDDGGRGELVRGAIEAQRAWILEVSLCPVGYGIISHDFFGRSFLDLILIAESQRSKGYGPRLIAFLEGLSRSNDLFTSTNQSNSHMRHVLEKLGYERSGIIHNLDPDDPEIVYVKRVEC